MKVLLACDRSAGHIFPALSIGEKIKKEIDDSADDKYTNNKVCFFATASFLKRYVEDSGFIVIGKSFSNRNLFIEGFWRLFEALYIIITFRPDKVIGFGGRDSFFLVFFSALLGVETVIYEPNLNFGKTNKVLSVLAGRILRGFPVNKKKNKVTTIGVPIRRNIKKINKNTACRILNFNSKPVIFCLGGSQGSHLLNCLFMNFARSLNNEYQIIHLTGKKDYRQISEFYDKIRINSFVKDFYYNIEILYSACDVLVSRAGANVLGEISFFKIPSLLVPHSGGGNHQKDNALYFQNKGAAFVCTEGEFLFKEFTNKLNILLEDKNVIREMKANLGRIDLGVKFENFCSSNGF